MTPLLAALARYDIRSVIGLWRNGYALTSEEAVAAEQVLTCRRGPKQKPDTRAKLERSAKIIIRYKQMRADGIPKKKCEADLAAEFRMDVRSIIQIVRGGDWRRVKPIIDEWGGVPPAN